MKRRLAIWMYSKALKMEPLIALGVQQAADENAAQRLRQAQAEADLQQRHLQQYQANAARIAPNN